MDWKRILFKLVQLNRNFNQIIMLDVNSELEFIENIPQIECNAFLFPDYCGDQKGPEISDQLLL